MRLGSPLAAAAVVAALMHPASAYAVPDCTDVRAPKTLASGQGVLESVLVTSAGLLVWSDSNEDALMSIDAPGAAPRVVAEGIDKPGGLLEDLDGTLIVGSGNGFQEGAVGNVMGIARLLRVDLATGRSSVYAEGLAMANGLAWGPNREIYASDDAGIGIDKVVEGEVQPRWATAVSANGLAVNAAGTHLFAAQTFQPPAILRIPLADPETVETVARGEPADLTAGLDGMAIDQLDRLYVAANGGGQVWRADPDGKVCRLAGGLTLPSAVALGGTSLYVVTFSGVVAELERIRPLPAQPGAVTAAVAPRTARRGHRVRLRVRLQPPMPNAKLRVSGRTLVTDGAGRAVRVMRFRRGGRLPITLRGGPVGEIRVR